MEITAMHAQCPILVEKILSLGGSMLLLSPAFGDNSANCPTLQHVARISARIVWNTGQDLDKLCKQTFNNLAQVRSLQ